MSIVNDGSKTNLNFCNISIPTTTDTCELYYPRRPDGCVRAAGERPSVRFKRHVGGRRREDGGRRCDDDEETGGGACQGGGAGGAGDAGDCGDAAAGRRLSGWVRGGCGGGGVDGYGGEGVYQATVYGVQGFRGVHRGYAERPVVHPAYNSLSRSELSFGVSGIS